MTNKPFFANGLNVQNMLQVSDTQVTFGANIVINMNDFTIGNSSVNSFSNSIAHILGSVSLNTTAASFGANVFLDTTRLSVGNSTVNLIANSILVSLSNSSGIANLSPTLLTIGTALLNTTALGVGANVLLNQSTLSIGNTTVNVAVLSNLIRVSNSSGVGILEPALLSIGGSTINSTAVNTSFTKTVTANIAGNAQIFSIGIGTAASGIQGRVLATDNLISYFSDKRLKESLFPIEDALRKIKTLTGYTYFHNELAEKFGFLDYSQQVGLLAQEVQPILPHAIHIAPFDLDEKGNSKSGENYLTIQYEKLIPLIIEAIKELAKKIE